jgi:hypothetical protein
MQPEDDLGKEGLRDQSRRASEATPEDSGANSVNVEEKGSCSVEEAAGAKEGELYPVGTA